MVVEKVLQDYIVSFFPVILCSEVSFKSEIFIEICLLLDGQFEQLRVFRAEILESLHVPRCEVELICHRIIWLFL